MDRMKIFSILPFLIVDLSNSMVSTFYVRLCSPEFPNREIHLGSTNHILYPIKHKYNQKI